MKRIIFIALNLLALPIFGDYQSLSLDSLPSGLQFVTDINVPPDTAETDSAFQEFSLRPTYSEDFVSEGPIMMYYSDGTPVTDALILGDSLYIDCCLVKRNNPEVKDYYVGIMFYTYNRSKYEYFTDSLHVHTCEIGDTIKRIYIDPIPAYSHKNKPFSDWRSKKSHYMLLTFHPADSAQYWRFNGIRDKPITMQQSMKISDINGVYEPCMYDLYMNVTNITNRRAVCYYDYKESAQYGTGWVKTRALVLEPNEVRQLYFREPTQDEVKKKSWDGSWTWELKTYWEHSYLQWTYISLQWTVYEKQLTGPYKTGVEEINMEEAFTGWTLPEVREIHLSKYVRSADWYPVYLPFSFNPAYFKYPSFTLLARVDSIYESGKNGPVVLLMTKLGGEMQTKANHPYLMYNSSSGDRDFQMIRMDEIAEPEIKSVTFHGKERDYTITGTYDYVTDMATKGHLALSRRAFCYAADDSVTLGPFRWYVDIKSKDGSVVTGNAPRQVEMLIQGEEDATGIHYYEKPIPAPGCFDLGGHRMPQTDPKQLPRGLYIINGKKYLR